MSPQAHRLVEAIDPVLLAKRLYEELDGLSHLDPKCGEHACYCGLLLARERFSRRIPDPLVPLDALEDNRKSRLLRACNFALALIEQGGEQLHHRSPRGVERLHLLAAELRRVQPQGA